MRPTDDSQKWNEVNNTREERHGVREGTVAFRCTVGMRGCFVARLQRSGSAWVKPRHWEGQNPKCIVAASRQWREGESCVVLLTPSTLSVACNHADCSGAEDRDVRSSHNNNLLTEQPGLYYRLATGPSQPVANLPNRCDTTSPVRTQMTITKERSSQYISIISLQHIYSIYIFTLFVLLFDTVI